MIEQPKKIEGAKFLCQLPPCFEGKEVTLIPIQSEHTSLMIISEMFEPHFVLKTGEVLPHRMWVNRVGLA